MKNRMLGGPASTGTASSDSLQQIELIRTAGVSVSRISYRSCYGCQSGLVRWESLQVEGERGTSARTASIAPSARYGHGESRKESPVLPPVRR